MKFDSMIVPSGNTYERSDMDLILAMNRYGFIRHMPGGFILASGIQSHIYVFGRNDVTDNPELGWLIGRKTAQIITTEHQEGDLAPCLIGVPTAGNAIAAAASYVAYAEGIKSPAGEISYRVMRETVKTHGAGANQWINGPFDDNFHTFWGIENVVTTGITKNVAAGRLIESGYPAHKMPWLIFVDRQQGGLARMAEAGFERVVVAYFLLDIAYAMGQLGEWPKDLVETVKEEIAAHQV